MKKEIIFLLTALFLYRCSLFCEKKRLTEDEKGWFEVYNEGDTLILMSDRKNFDTLIVTSNKNYFSNCNRVELGKYQFETSFVFLKSVNKHNILSDYDNIQLRYSINSMDHNSDLAIKVFDLGYYSTKDGDFLTEQKLQSSINNKAYTTFYFEFKDSTSSMMNSYLQSFNWSKKHGLVRYTTKKGEIFEYFEKLGSVPSDKK